jgi:membrane protein implicated in regulation of membrane protease activity
MLSIDLQDLRDLTIVIFTIAGTVMFVFATLAAMAAAIAFVTAIRAIRALRRNLEPTLEGLQDTVSNLRGTSAFVSENAVSPIIRVYGVYSGARRFAGVMSRVFRRGRD